MNGVAIIRALMVAHAPLTAVVPAARIVAGIVPLNTVLPAIGITHVSVVDRHTLKQGAVQHTTDRVQVTVMAPSYPQLKQLIALVRKAGGYRLGGLAGATGVAVRTEGTGPDLAGEAGVLMQPQDFRVSYNLPA